MSSFFDEASLVMIPSGYKDQKVYSVKPLDGSGDLTFSRASDATRVASNGLIEKVRTNLALQSQTFDNASWTSLAVSVSVTENVIVDPFGGNDADIIVADAITSNIIYVRQAITLPSTGTYTYSVYVKKQNQDTVGLRSLASGLLINYDLVNETSSNPAGFIEDAGNGWFRIGLTYTSGTTSEIIFIYPLGTGTRTGNGVDGVYVFGAQLEVSDFGATDYIATTTTAVSVGPVSGLPRLDYLNSSCPRLLLEQQRTNLFTFSESFSDYYTNRVSKTDLGPATIIQGGHMARFTANSALAFFGKTASLTSGTTYTLSAIFDITEGLYAGIRDSLSDYNIFNVSNGSLVGSSGSITINCVSTKIGTSNYHRVAFTFTAVTSGNHFFAIGTSSGTLSTTNETVAAGYFQREDSASYATSYIPTLSTSVTRVADAASKTGISSLIGQTEGTIFIDVENNESETSCIISTNAGAGANSHIYIGQSGNNLALYVRSGGTYSIIAASIANVIGRKKIALAYGASFARIYMNGTQVYNSTDAVIPSGLDRIEMNVFDTSSDIGNVKFNQALYFTTKLTDTQLAELTTL
jgi:hypothetical protein